jgi:hypothetical protein
MSGIAECERFERMPVGMVYHRRKWRVIRTDDRIPTAPGQRIRQFILLHADGGAVLHVCVERATNGQIFTYTISTSRSETRYTAKHVDTSGLSKYGLMVPALWSYAKAMEEKAGKPAMKEDASVFGHKPTPQGPGWLASAPRSPPHAEDLTVPAFVRERFPRRVRVVPALTK